MSNNFDIERLTRYAKPILVIVNVVSFILGVAFVSIGCYISTQEIGLVKLNESIALQHNEEHEKAKSEANYYLQIVFSSIIGVGLLITLLNLFGCLGAIKESKILLTSYIIFVVFITIAQITGMVLLLIYEAKLKLSISNVLRYRLSYYKEELGLTNKWNEVMKNFECCGVNGMEDFFQIAQQYKWVKFQELPKYCCPSKSNTCKFDEGDVNIPGCLEQYFDSELHRIDILILAIEIFLNVLGIISSAFILRKSVEGSKKFWEWKSHAYTFKTDSRMQPY